MLRTSHGTMHSRPIDRLWRDCWCHPAQRTLYGLWDHMALLTLPRGPSETTQSWYANARLGVYVLTLILWGGGLPGPQIHYFVSRGKEKSVPYSFWSWRWAMQNLVCMDQIENICWWSDGGRHFRSNISISTMAVRGVEMLGQRSHQDRHNHQMDISFGVPSHFKNHCDGAQAHLRHLLSEVAKTRVVSSIDKLIPTCRALYDEFKSDPMRPTRLPAHFHDHSPLDDRGKFVEEY